MGYGDYSPSDLLLESLRVDSALLLAAHLSASGDLWQVLTVKHGVRVAPVCMEGERLVALLGLTLSLEVVFILRLIVANRI